MNIKELISRYGLSAGYVEGSEYNEQEILRFVDEIREQDKARIATLEADRDCWVFNAKALQTGYNELDAKLRASEARIATLEAELLAARDLLASEREACAKICEANSARWDAIGGDGGASLECADAIRAGRTE